MAWKGRGMIGGFRVWLYCLALRRGKAKTRQWAAVELGELRDPRGIEPLIQAIHSDYDVKFEAAAALAKFDDPRVVVPLIEAINFTYSAAEGLARIGDARAVDPLIAALDQDDWMVREAAAKALGKFGDRRAVEPLLKTLSDRERLVRRSAAYSLGNLGDPCVVEPVIKLLDDGSELVRWSAAQSLEKLGDRRAIEPLIKSLADEDKNVRKAAAQALGTLSDARAIEPLIQALGDTIAEQRKLVAAALAKLGEMKWKDIVQGDEADWKRLDECDDLRAFAPLIRPLHESHKAHEDVVTVALGKLGPRAIERLSSLAQDGCDRTRASALIALGRFATCDNAIVGGIVEGLTDSSRRVRMAASKTLAKLGDPRAVPALMGVMARVADGDDISMDEVRAVVAALKSIGLQHLSPNERQLIELVGNVAISGYY
jgi:HEAT repeat protein